MPSIAWPSPVFTCSMIGLRFSVQWSVHRNRAPSLSYSYLVELWHHQTELTEHVVEVVIHLTHPESRLWSLKQVLPHLSDSPSTWLSMLPMFLLDFFEYSSVWSFTWVLESAMPTVVRGFSFRSHVGWNVVLTGFWLHLTCWFENSFCFQFWTMVSYVCKFGALQNHKGPSLWRKMVQEVILIAHKKRFDALNAMQEPSALCKIP